MRRGFSLAQTQYAIGGSQVAVEISRRAGFGRVGQLNGFHKILNPMYRLKSQDLRPLGKYLRVATDIGRSLIHYRRPAKRVEAQNVDTFGPEILSILRQCESKVGYTDRGPELLNYYLKCPAGDFSGWLLKSDDKTIGFAVLNCLQHGRIHESRIVDCFLSCPDPPLWRSAISAILQKMPRRIDFVSCLSSTPWMRQALERNGFFPTSSAPLAFRDQDSSLPSGVEYHLSYLEADLGYLH